MGDAHPGSHQERVFHHGNRVRGLEPGRCGTEPVAEPVLLRFTVERIALHLHTGRPRLLDWSLGGQQNLMSRTPGVTLGVWGIRVGDGSIMTSPKTVRPSATVVLGLFLFLLFLVSEGAISAPPRSKDDSAPSR